MSLFNRTSFRKPSSSQPYYTMAIQALCAVLALSAILIKADAHAASDDESLVKQHTTPAGHTFWHHAMPDTDRTSITIIWQQEVAFDEGPHPALPRLGVAMMENGPVGEQDADEIKAELKSLNITAGFTVRPTYAEAYIVAPDENLSKAREIIQHMLTRPEFKQQTLEREKQSMIENRAKFQLSPSGRVWAMLDELVLHTHPYSQFWQLDSIAGFELLSLDDVNNWHKSSFSTKTATITVAGSATADTVAQEIDMLFADLPSIAAKKPVASYEPKTPAKTILLHNPDVPKAYIVLQGDLPSNIRAGNPEIKFAVAVLGDGRQSLLFNNVQPDLDLYYNFSARVPKRRPKNLTLRISGGVENANIQEAFDQIEKTYSDFLKSGISKQDLPNAKAVYNESVFMEGQSSFNVARAINAALRHGYDADYPLNEENRVENIDRNSLNTLISDAFPPYENLLKLVISPDKNALTGACVITKVEDAINC